LDSDPRRAIQQALWLLGLAANRLRNAEGIGHGRPGAPTLSDKDARLTIQALGIVSELLLNELT